MFSGTRVCRVCVEVNVNAGSSSSGRDGRGGGSRAAAPWERPMLPMGGGGGMMVDNAAGGNFGAIERMAAAAERRGGTRYRLKMRGVPFRATEDDVYSVGLQTMGEYGLRYLKGIK